VAPYFFKKILLLPKEEETGKINGIFEVGGIPLHKHFYNFEHAFRIE